MSIPPKFVTASTLAIILFLTVLAYSNTFYGEFQFDDDLTILYNQRVKDPSLFLQGNPLMNIIHAGRPVTDLTFAFNYYLGGLDVFGYYILNLFIHIINGLLLYYLVLLTMRSPFIPEED